MNDSEATEPIQEWEEENGRGQKEKAASSDASTPDDFLPSDDAEKDASSEESSFVSPSTPYFSGRKTPLASTESVIASEKGGARSSDVSESFRHEERASIIESADQSSQQSKEEHPDVSKTAASPLNSDKTNKEEADGKTSVRVTAEQSGSYAYPDGSAASSQRMRPIPPNAVQTPWWSRHRKELLLAEMILTGLFFLLALYFLVMWIFAKPAMACVPQASWKVPAIAGRWRSIVVHHTATERSSPASIDRYHREVRKWEGLGYHFLIGNGRSNGRDPTLENGDVHVGVRWREQRDGAHVRMKEFKNANSFAIGVALIGNFEKEAPTPQQIAALRCLLEFLMKEYGISKNNIHGHGQVSAQHTECPGKLFPLERVIASL